MNKAFRIAAGTFRQELGSPRVIMGYLLGLTFLALGLKDFLRFAAYLQEPVNILEAFIVTESQRSAEGFWLMGYLLVVADAPFVRADTYFILYRGGRRLWSLGMTLYILWQAFFYTLLAAAVSVLASVPGGYFGGLWSSPVFVLVKDAGGVFEESYQLYFPFEAMLRDMTPFRAFGAAFLYMFCYCAFFGMLLYFCSAAFGGVWNLPAAALLHLGSRYLPFPSPLAWCPGQYAGAGFGGLKYPGLELAGILLMTAASLFAVQKTDFRVRGEGGEGL